MGKRIFALLAVALVLALPLTARASGEPELRRPGSVTFLLEWEGEPLEGGSLTLFPVGTFEKIGNDYVFALIPALADSGISLEAVDSPETAARLAAAVAELSLEGTRVEITEGRAFFGELLPGLYLAVQREAVPGFEELAPFLISLPKLQNGSYVYDLTAEPKVPLHEAPTEPPTEPTEPTEPEEPDLPQTGQLNWPVPLMAVWGAALLILGTVLCVKGKQPDEK